MDKSMLASLESLPEAYQQRMASMMEQVQIRDSFGLHGLPTAREVQPIKGKIEYPAPSICGLYVDVFGILLTSLVDHLIVITIFCFCFEIFADDSRDWFVRLSVIVAAIGSGKVTK
ncbi:hypothetical protein HN873_032542 [Arachis hypogaea]